MWSTDFQQTHKLYRTKLTCKRKVQQTHNFNFVNKYTFKYSGNEQLKSRNSFPNI